MNILKRFFPYILILILSFLAFKSLIVPGFFSMHDDTQVTRVFEMAKALADGMFPVRWSMDLGFGFGYPIFNFYAPFAYYIGGIINLLGLNALDATKLTMIIGIIVSGFSMYVFSKEFFGKAGGIFSALLYVYAPYHALDIYVRGDVAEFFAYAFIPLMFFGLYKIYKENKFTNILITAISFALIILSHNLTAFLITPFALIFTMFLIYKNKKTFNKYVIAYILGLSLSAFYFIPALLEMKYTNVLSQIGGGADFKDHFVCLSQLWASPWGYGGSAKGCIDGISFMIGKYHLIFGLTAVALILFYLFSKKIIKLSDDEKSKLPFIIIIFVFFLVSIFLMLDISRPVWEILKPMEFLQFPWRFLILTVFCLSFVSGALLWITQKFIKGNSFYLLFVISSLVVVIVNVKFFIPQKFLHISSEDYTRTDIINWDISKISYEYMPKNFPPQSIYTANTNFNSININQNLLLRSVTQNTKSLNLLVNVINPSEMVVPIAYFPAWQVFVDGKQGYVSSNGFSSWGKVTFYLPNKGEHVVNIKYIETPIEKVSDAISIAGLLVVILGIIYFRKKHD